MPSLIEYFSYVYFVGGCICGPWFEFSDYIRFVEKKDEYEKIPSTIIPSLVRFA